MLHVTLFGRFGASLGTDTVRVREGSKAEELLVFLLLHRQRPHTRERVACLLWEECPEDRSRAYLRKALWELQSALQPSGCGGCPLLRVDATWVQVDPGAELWLDVAAFECAYEHTRGVPGHQIGAAAAGGLAEAVALYAGGLLQDHYQEWCLVERERLRHLYLVMLDKLVEYSEARRDYELGVLYGLEILRHDAAREQTHRQLMRLHQLRGDRTGALRQFRACVQVLDAELGVEPMEETVQLHEQIRDGAPAAGAPAGDAVSLTADALQAVMAQLRSLHDGLAEVRRSTERIAVALHADPAPAEREAPTAP